MYQFIDQGEAFQTSQRAGDVFFPVLADAFELDELLKRDVLENFIKTIIIKQG